MKVEALFEISDDELAVLLKLASESEDVTIKAALETNGFLHMWRGMSQMRSLSRTGKVFFSATIQQLSLVTELLEADDDLQTTKLHAQFQEILTNSLTEQQRVSPRILEE